MNMKKYFILLLVTLLLSCNTDDEINCLRGLVIQPIEIPRATEFQEVHADSNYKINVSAFITPNGDGVNDVFFIYIEDLSNNSFYITSDFGVIGNISPNTTQDPSTFFTAIDLSVSNDCETLHTSSNTLNYTWALDFNNPVSEGNYNLDFTLDMVNGSPVTISTSFDLYYP